MSLVSIANALNSQIRAVKKVMEESYYYNWGVVSDS